MSALPAARSARQPLVMTSRKQLLEDFDKNVAGVAHRIAEASDENLMKAMDAFRGRQNHLHRSAHRRDPQLLPQPRDPSSRADGRLFAPQRCPGAVGLRPLRRRESVCISTCLPSRSGRSFRPATGMKVQLSPASCARLGVRLEPPRTNVLASGFSAGFIARNRRGRRFVMLIPVQSAKWLSVSFPHEMPIWKADVRAFAPSACKRGPCLDSPRIRKIRREVTHEIL